MLCTSARNVSGSELLDLSGAEKIENSVDLVSIEELTRNSWCSYPFLVSSRIPLGLLRLREREKEGGGRQTLFANPTTK